MLRGDRRRSTRWTIFNNLFAIINRSLFLMSSCQSGGTGPGLPVPLLFFQSTLRHFLTLANRQHGVELREAPKNVLREKKGPNNVSGMKSNDVLTS